MVAGIVVSTSLTLGLLVLLAAPIIVGVALPLLRPLHHLDTSLPPGMLVGTVAAPATCAVPRQLLGRQ